MSRAWTRLVESVEAVGLDERVVQALLPAFSDAKVRRTIYQQDADLSDQQAIRDIRDLVARGWLVPHGKTRARYYAPGPLMAPVREEVRQSMEPYTWLDTGLQFLGLADDAVGVGGVQHGHARTGPLCYLCWRNTAVHCVNQHTAECPTSRAKPGTVRPSLGPTRR
jgi:hypothetical protein